MQASAHFPMPLRRGIGWELKSHICTKGEKVGAKGYVGSLQIKQHSTGFHGSADDSSTEPGM